MCSEVIFQTENPSITAGHGTPLDKRAAKTRAFLSGGVDHREWRSSSNKEQAATAVTSRGRGSCAELSADERAAVVELLGGVEGLVVRRELLAWTAEEGWPLADKRTAKVVVQGAEPEVLRWRLDRLGLPRLDAARNRHW
eukprot:jgi/Tetstr1/466598/TSEL_011086.t1